MRNLALLAAVVVASVAGCAASAKDDALVAEDRAAAIDEPHGIAGAPLPTPSRSGSVIARSPKNDALYIADEDHALVRRLAMPLDVNQPQVTKPTPGVPAQVLALDGKVLVTVRDPAMLLVLDDRGDGELHESARINLPADAWGIAVTKDEHTALVTSAWTSKVTAIDLTTNQVTGTVDVAREPRGIVIADDGSHAYVSHLVGAKLTRLDLDDDGKLLAPTRVSLPASPLRAPIGTALDASLGYSLVLSDDGSRLFAPRHALGAMGDRYWYGSPTVDVLLTRDDSPLVAQRTASAKIVVVKDPALDEVHLSLGAMPFTEVPSMAQPRAAVYRASTRTLLVASEGNDTLVEMSATAIDPAVRPIGTYYLGDRRSQKWQTASFCGAPSGIALSADEALAYVFCRSTDDLAIVSLDREGVAGMKLDESPFSKTANIGRRLFFFAGDDRTSGGLACAGCHPDGRDDGHVWHEAVGPMTGGPIFVADRHAITNASDEPLGYARQTPMLAGHVSAKGPYGWHAQSADLGERAMEGFTLHRWDGGWAEPETQKILAAPIAAYLREGLAPPPVVDHDLTTEEARGKQLFESESVGCASCHTPATGYTDRYAYQFDLPARPGFEADPNGAFKTPSLLSVGGTAPYLHDGSEPTLEALIDDNRDRMGHTSQLSKSDRAALVAFLRTL
jgi:YVTN family beta-propeller protein